MYMYNLVKGMWNKLTKKEEPDLTDPDVPILNLIVVEPVLDVPDVPVEVVYIVLNDFEMETMADEDIPIEKKEDVVLDLDPIINIIVDVVLDVVLDPTIVSDPVIAAEEIISEEEAVILNEEEVKKPKKAKKLKKS